MEEQLFRKTESRLAGYYRQQEEAVFLNAAIAAVERQIETISGLLVEAAELIPSFGLIGTYGAAAPGRSSSPSDPTSTAYAACEQAEVELRSEIARLARRRIRLLLQRSEAEAAIGLVAGVLERLPAEEREILEQRYLYRRSHVIIGSALGMDESTVRYRLRVITAKLANCLELI